MLGQSAKILQDQGPVIKLQYDYLNYLFEVFAEIGRQWASNISRPCYLHRALEKRRAKQGLAVPDFRLGGATGFNSGKQQHLRFACARPCVQILVSISAYCVRNLSHVSDAG